MSVKHEYKTVIALSTDDVIISGLKRPLAAEVNDRKNAYEYQTINAFSTPIEKQWSHYKTVTLLAI